ncbi:potassium channel family protein [Thalassotalea sp. Y01]|uniref:potassium channel family protein n=1 Tax=Thalassotalea sp. Y01 TaxID=2729613 RepID=UPI00145EEA2D|nr:potassium channel family protein [Thalassotalea sp. Y01]NMP16389.1 two pore domain potassium channel family protein [Thalassotalea sp. Y01]
MIVLSLVTTVVVATCVVLHYEALRSLSRRLPYLHYNNKYQIVVGVVGALLAHCVQVWIFALGYYFMMQDETFGTLKGNFNGSLLDCTYFSFTTFSTVGFGDIEPHGAIRFYTGVESLTGLLLITWTASFLFLEMQRYWQTES